MNGQLRRAISQLSRIAHWQSGSFKSRVPITTDSESGTRTTGSNALSNRLAQTI